MLYLLMLLAGAVACGLVWFPWRRRWPLRIVRIVAVCSLVVATAVAMWAWQQYGYHGFGEGSSFGSDLGAVH